MILVQVCLFTSYHDLLWYSVSEEITIGTVVVVPLQKRTVYGFIFSISNDHSVIKKFKIRSIIRTVIGCSLSNEYINFLKLVGKNYFCAWQSFLLRMHPLLRCEVKKDIILLEKEVFYVNQKEIVLTAQQEIVVRFIVPGIKNSLYLPVLLHGVTGSGKTEVYKKLIIEAFYSHKSVILLLPEINLVLAFIKRLVSDLGPTFPIFALHAKTDLQSKNCFWNFLKNNQPCLLIGVHIPLFIPLDNLGLIIVDEEHELGYYEKQYPKINSKYIAILRAQSKRIPILLGSATPSLYALHQVKLKKWYFFQLNDRFVGAFPHVTIVPLCTEKKRKFFWISSMLYDEIKQALERNQQVILFLNRRGYAFFVQCQKCGYIFICSHCSVSLTFHQNETLICHYCNFTQSIDAICPQCHAADLPFLKKGIGTQQIVEMVKKLFPGFRVERADLDSTILQKKWHAAYQDFIEGKINILVGTQTIAKGHHFPGVSLVGVIWADMNFHIPLFNATEVAIQQLIQVAGRAGRTASFNGKVIMQTIADHENFNYINERDYLKLYQKEIVFRQALNYPPVGILIEFLLIHKKKEIVYDEANQIFNYLEDMIPSFSTIKILGPTSPLVEKIKNQERRLIYLKGTNKNEINFLIENLKKRSYKSKIFITPLF